MLALNADASRMSVIDINGILSLVDLRADGGRGEHLAMERKDAWGMQWSSDDPQLLAIMEKTRMYIFRGMEPEEPVLSSGYLCAFSDLRITAVLLDDMMAAPDQVCSSPSRTSSGPPSLHVGTPKRRARGACATAAPAAVPTGIGQTPAPDLQPPTHPPPLAAFTTPDPRSLSVPVHVCSCLSSCFTAHRLHVCSLTSRLLCSLHSPTRT